MALPNPLSSFPRQLLPAPAVPTGLAIDVRPGLVAGTLGSAADTASASRVTVTASDGSAGASQTFTWVVVPATTAQENVHWTGAGGDTNWDNPLNWDSLA